MGTLIPSEYIKAGKVVREVREWVSTRMKPGIEYISICTGVEEEIERRGASPAFPCAVGVNQVTAHFAPQTNETRAVLEDDLVKIDFGAHVDGYVADTAITITYNPAHQLLLEAAQKSLLAAINVLKQDRRIGEVGRAIEAEASRAGFKPISNLSGHTLDRYVVHAGKSIPNLYIPNLPTLKKGEVFAVEPFVTMGDAAGYVTDAPQETIFSLIARKRTGSEKMDDCVEMLWTRRRTLPFTPRWFERDYKPGEFVALLKELEARRLVRAYPTLVEASNRPVAQFEHTIALGDNGITVLT